MTPAERLALERQLEETVRRTQRLLSRIAPWRRGMIWTLRAASNDNSKKRRMVWP